MKLKTLPNYYTQYMPAIREYLIMTAVYNIIENLKEVYDEEIPLFDMWRRSKP